MPSLSRSALVPALLAALAWTHAARAAKIACVGDSITFGYGLSNPDTESYPAVLAARLGKDHTVQNFGVSGATLLKSGDRPYWDESNFTASGSFAPDVVVVMLGTNDAKPQNWSQAAKFSPDYLELILHYRALGALVYVATPPPVYAPGAFDIPPDVVASEVVPLVRTIAGDATAPLVDVFSALTGKSEDFPDTVHPNAAGATLIADTVLAALQANGFGGAGTAGAGGVGQGGRASAGGGASSGAGAGTAMDQGGRGGGSGSAGTSGDGMLARGAGAGGLLLGSSGNGAGQGGRANGVAGRSEAGGGLGAMSAGRSGSPPVAGGAPSAGSGSALASAGSPGAARSTGNDGGGCGCRVGRSGASGARALCAAFALLLAGSLRRRRRRRGSRR